MTYRFYFWFKGVPKDRIGGPWWSRDFTNANDMWSFKCTALPFLHAYAIDDQNIIYFSGDGREMSTPPQNLKIIFTED